MKSTSRLWRSLEATPFLRGVKAQWAEYVAEDLPLLEPYLPPEERPAESYPCPSQGGDGCPRGIVVHSDDHVVAFCRDRTRSCEDLRLTREDVIVRRLDHAGIAALVARLLGFRGCGPVPEEDLQRTFRLGVYRPLAGLEYPAFLTFQSERFEFSALAERLVAREGRPFLLLAPTADLLGGPAGERLRKAGGAVLGLDEVLASDDGGRFVLAREADQVLAAFRASVVEETRRSLRAGMVLFETPADATWHQLKVRFRGYNTDIVSVEVCGKRATVNYTQMGMADGRSSKRDKQWDLLLQFAKGHGYMTWDSPGADRNNQKRCERLSKALSEFFRIPGPPIEYREANKGWFTLFDVSE